MLTKNVIPIPPSYNKDESLDINATQEYIRYLVHHGATTVMTTAGTSQFNLMSADEVHTLNKAVSQANCLKILGVPPVPTNEAVRFVKRSNEYRGSANLIVLYPDRFYSHQAIYEHMSKIREASTEPLYLHSVPMRCGLGGEWNFTSDVVSELFDKKLICGIKEEHSNLQKSYDFIRSLPAGLDVIVAGGSMRRHQFLRSAGANSFLSGLGNFFPEIEIDYCNEIDNGRSGDKQIALESKLFDVFLKYGWHPCLREGLVYLGLLRHYNRMPWPKLEDNIVEEIKKVILGFQNEK